MNKQFTNAAVAASIAFLVAHAGAQVSQSGDIVTTNDTLTYGQTGLGQLRVTGGTTFRPRNPDAPSTPFSVFFGAGPGGFGLGTVAGAGSLFEVDRNLTLGSNGGGVSFQVNVGGRVDVGGQTFIDTAFGGLIGLTIDGTDSVYNGGDSDFTVREGRVVVRNNGRLIPLSSTGSDVTIGDRAGSSAELSVTSGGVFDATATIGSNSDGEVFIGNNRGGSSGQAFVNVNSGGQFLADDVFIRSRDTAPAIVTVEGSGTQFIANRRIQHSDGSSEMVVTNGATNRCD